MQVRKISESRAAITLQNNKPCTLTWIGSGLRLRIAAHEQPEPTLEVHTLRDF